MSKVKMSEPNSHKSTLQNYTNKFVLQTENCKQVNLIKISIVKNYRTKYDCFLKEGLSDEDLFCLKL